MEMHDDREPPGELQRARDGGSAAQRRDAVTAQGIAPRLVIRGESLEEDTSSYGGESFVVRPRGRHAELVAIPQPRKDAHPYAALTDYLNLTFPFAGNDEDIRVFVSQHRAFLGIAYGGLNERGKGLHGYQRSFAFEHGHVLLATGGQRGTAFFSLPGEACAMVPDWAEAQFFFEKVLGARITRWDGAVDDYEGAHSIDHAVDQYRAGGFTAGGNKPSCSPPASE